MNVIQISSEQGFLRFNPDSLSLLKDLIQARTALGSLDGYLSAFENLETYVHLFSVREAQAAMQLSGLNLQLEEIFQAESSEMNWSPVVAQSLRNHEAFHVGRDLMSSGSACLSLIAEEVWAILFNQSREPLVLSENHDRPNDPLLRIFIDHAQWLIDYPESAEIIGLRRIMDTLDLLSSEILCSPVIAPSSSINVGRYEYERLVYRLRTAGEVEPLVAFLVQTITDAARTALHQLRVIRLLESEVATAVQAHSPEFSAQLSQHLFRYPVTRIADVVIILGVSRPTAAKYLNQLADAGVLKRQAAGREQLYFHTRLLEILGLESFLGFTSDQALTPKMLASTQL